MEFECLSISLPYFVHKFIMFVQMLKCSYSFLNDKAVCNVFVFLCNLWCRLYVHQRRLVNTEVGEVVPSLFFATKWRSNY